jgi:glycopeptide antibiotics resistance protein
MKMVLFAKSTIINRVILGMGIAYTLFLVWAVLWKCGVPYIGGQVRIINIVPFNNNTGWELQFNIAVFMPLGFYIAAAMRKATPIKLVLMPLFVSLVLEILQFMLAIGRSDVTDLLMNTLGGWIGIAAFLVLARLFRKYKHIAALLVCILMTLFEVYMTVSFAFFGFLDLGYMIIRL